MSILATVACEKVTANSLINEDFAVIMAFVGMKKRTVSDMAYIDRTLVQKCLDDLSSENLIGNENDTFISLAEAKDRIEELPTADVVPKSEVEKLKSDLLVWKQNRFNIFQRLECYEMTRQKIAREIFAEIEQQLRGLFDFFRQDDCIRESSAIMLAISEIAELKKKYTEENQNVNGN